MSDKKTVMQRLLTEPAFAKKALWLTAGLAILGVILLALEIGLSPNNVFYGGIGVATALILFGIVFFAIAMRTVRRK